MRFAIASLFFAAYGLSAATIACGNGGVNDSGPIGLATTVFAPPTPSTFSCFQQDKIYSGFILNSGSVAGVSMEIFFQPVGLVDNHTVQFSGNLTQAFDLEYDVTVDISISPDLRLSLVGVDINAAASGGNPTITKSSPNFATIIASKSTGSQATTIPNLISVHVHDVYNPNGGAATSSSNSFVETPIPEPGTMMLLGGALLLVGAKRWRK